MWKISLMQSEILAAIHGPEIHLTNVVVEESAFPFWSLPSVFMFFTPLA